MRSPPTNLVCASADGALAFRVSAAAPKRRGFDGRLPVPGTGAYDWEGLRDDLPQELNPPRGWIATANNNIHPPGFRNPLFFTGRAPYWRYQRIAHLIDEGKTSGKKFTVDDLRVMLRDSYKTEAEQLKPWFQGWTASPPDIERARSVVASWDNQMRKESAAAAVYQTWRDAGGRRRHPAGARRRTQGARRGRTAQGRAGPRGGAGRGSGRLALGPDPLERLQASAAVGLRPAGGRARRRRRHRERDRRRLPVDYGFRGPRYVDGHDRSRNLRAARQSVLR